MFARKKSRLRLDLDTDFGSVNPGRTYNVRHQKEWPDKLLYGIDNKEAAADQDEYDKQQQSFFDCGSPKSNDAILFGSTEVLPPDRPIEEKNRVKDVSLNAMLDLLKLRESRDNPHLHLDQNLPATAKAAHVIEVSDDDCDKIITEEVKTQTTPRPPSTIVTQKQHDENVVKLTSYLRKMGTEPTDTLQFVEKKKSNDDFLLEKFRNNMKKEYTRVFSQDNRRKTTFMLLPGDPEHYRDLVDSPDKVDNVRFKDGRHKQRSRSSSPILFDFSSDDEAPLVTKKPEPALKKASPPTVTPKRPIFGKFARRNEDEAPKIALPPSALFVPRKDSKLRSGSLDEFLRKSKAADAEREEWRMARIERERKEREDKVKKMKKVVPPSADEKSSEQKKKVRVISTSETVEGVDILGAITEAMDAHAAETAVKEKSPDVMSPKKKAEQWVPIRFNDAPKSPPLVPRRFGRFGRHEYDDEDDTSSDDDMMDIANSSPEPSPRSSPRKKPISPASSDEGTEVEKQSRLNTTVSPTAGENNEVAIKGPHTRLNMDNQELGALFSAESLLDTHDKSVKLNTVVSPTVGDSNEVAIEGSQAPINMDNEEVGALFAAESLLGACDKTVSYRFIEVDNAYHIPAVVRQPEDMIVKRKNMKKILLDQNEAASDPRISHPSFGASRWTSTKVALNLGGDDVPMGYLKKDEDKRPEKKKKKKVVKWGETATRTFDPNDDDEMRPIEREKKSTETQEVVGEKEVGGRKYKIVKKVVNEPVLPKSCLKSPNAPSGSMMRGDRTPRGPAVTPIEMDEDEYDYPPINSFLIPPPPPPPAPLPVPPPGPMTNLSAMSRRSPKLSDFVPPPGYETEEAKKEREAKEKKREREAKEKKEREDRVKRMKELMEKDGERRRKDSEDSSSPEGAESSKPKRKFTPIFGEGVYSNRGASSSMSMGNLGGTLSKNTIFGRVSASMSLNNLSTGEQTITGPFEKGSEIVGAGRSTKAYNIEDAKYHLDMREKVLNVLKAHKTMRDDSEKEYPATRELPSMQVQLEEQDANDYELTPIEKEWKEQGIQSVWMKALPCETQFPFKHNAGLYWPTIQATDKIEENDPHLLFMFESMDVLRGLGNHTHFATEKKTLLGVDTCLPNGMTHKERFELAMKNKLDPRFKNRLMYSRVFSSQSVEDARALNDKRREVEKELLKEHEEVMKENAPGGVTIESCDVPRERPTRFRDFPSMIQHYRNDDYERDEPSRDPDWYCNKSDYYMPYSDRATYACHVINSFNEDYNKLYEEGGFDNEDVMVTLDKAAFAAAQLALERMEGCERVGVSQDEYIELMRRHKERTALLESSSFTLKKYMELCGLADVEKAHFHFIVDWLSSNFKLIKPISQYDMEQSLDASFRQIVMRSEKTDDEGQPRDAREVFYKAFTAAIPKKLHRRVVDPPIAKLARASSDDDDDE